jgi:hypothetical protein
VKARLEYARHHPAASRPSPSRVDRPDRDRGIGLLLRFAAGVAVMVGAVLVVGAVRRTWILIPAMVVLFVITAIVFAAIMRLLAEGASR